MANYKSSYTGAEIDAGIAKANTALQEHQDISGKVDKVEGKGLSTNDYTTAEKEKLAGIDMSTKQDVIDSSHKLSADLVEDGSTNKVVTSTEKSTWSGKQDALVSGTNIKTINNESILGSGNITIQGGGGSSTDVQINGTSITSSGTANIITEGTYNASPNSFYTKIRQTSKYFSTNKIATISDLPDITGKQDTLVSGTNIKTLNETSLLGSGDISIPAISGTIVYLLMDVLKNAVYKNDQTTNLDALEDELYDILPTVYYSVTNTLTNVTNDNPATQAEMGSSYTATLSLPDQSYALSSITITMGGLDVTNDVYDRENMEITIPNVIGNIVITAVAGNLSLDSLAYGDLTYRDIFITGNQLQAYDFENGKPSSAVVNAGSPEISDEAYCSPGHSAKFYGTSSCQYNDTKTITIAAGHTGFGAFKLKCDRYVKGYIGVSLSTFMPVDLTGTTNGWETKYKYRTVTNQNTQQLGFWGTYTQANADCYIDDMVFIDIDDVCGEVIPEQTMVRLYNEYVAIRESEV